MNINEFTALIKALFRNEKGKPYPIDNYMVTEIFNIFNKSGVSIVSRRVTIIQHSQKKLTFDYLVLQDGSMSKEEFAYCWNNWIKKVSNAVHCEQTYEKSPLQSSTLKSIFSKQMQS